MADKKAEKAPQFRYLGDCEAGEVRFTTQSGRVIVMPKGEAVTVDDAHLAGKLANNPTFERVS